MMPKMSIYHTKENKYLQSLNSQKPISKNLTQNSISKLNEAKNNTPVVPRNMSNNMSQSINQQPSILQTFKDSIIYGAGASIGMKVVDAITGPRKVEVIDNTDNKNPTFSNKSPDCKDLQNAFIECRKNYGFNDCEKEFKEVLKFCK